MASSPGAGFEELLERSMELRWRIQRMENTNGSLEGNRQAIWAWLQVVVTGAEQGARAPCPQVSLLWVLCQHSGVCHHLLPSGHSQASGPRGLQTHQPGPSCFGSDVPGS